MFECSMDSFRLYFACSGIAYLILNSIHMMIYSESNYNIIINTLNLFMIYENRPSMFYMFSNIILFFLLLDVYIFSTDTYDTSLLLQSIRLLDILLFKPILIFCSSFLYAELSESITQPRVHIENEKESLYYSLNDSDL